MNDTRWGVSRSALVILALGLAACGSKDSAGPPKAGPPASLTVVSGSGQEVASGEVAATPFTVKVVDQSGLAVSNAIVTFAITAGGGSLSATMDTSDASGLAAVTWTAGSSLGDARIEARVQGLIAPAAFTATVKAGPASALQRTSDAIGSAAAGFALGDSVAIMVADRFGHPVSGATVSFAVTAGGGTVSGATRTTGADGVARTTWTMGTGGPQTLRAASAGLELLISGTAVTCPESQMAVGDVLTINPGAPQCSVLAGTGQRYLVTVVNPTNFATATSTFKFRGAGSGAATSTTSAPITSISALSSAASAEIHEAEAAERIHSNVLRANMQLIERLGSPTRGNVRANSSSSVVLAQPLPNVGDIIDMKIPKNFNNLCDANIQPTSPDAGAARVRGRVVYIGTHSVMVEDSSNLLAGGQLDPLYRSVGQEFDNVMWPILTTNYGNPLAMDAQLQNTGRVFMLFSKVVNALQGGNLAGFVSSGDFYPPSTCAASNQEAVLYARVPTSTATGFQDGNTADSWFRSTRTVIIHETKHVTSFAEKLSRGGTPNGFFSRDQWLEESSAMLAEELWARGVFGYAQRGNTTYAQSIFCERRPTPNDKWPQCQPPKPISMLDHFYYAYEFEANADTRSMLGPVASDDFTFYGIGWLFLRWVLDQYAPSEPAFLTNMTLERARPGIENIENLTGKSFPQLFGEFSLALALDDYPNFVPRNPRHTVPSWNLREMFNSLSVDFAGSPYFTKPVPLKTRSSSFGSFSMDQLSVTGGGMAVMEISGTQTGRQLLEFKGAAGQDFPADMRINIIRVQ